MEPEEEKVEEEIVDGVVGPTVDGDEDEEL